MQVEERPRPEGDAAAIRVHDLVRRFGDFTAVDHVSFEVHRGEIFGLLGPNGAGKTTTFRMLCGLLRATDGTLEVAGVDVRHARASARERLGYVAQKFSLYGQLTVCGKPGFFRQRLRPARRSKTRAIGLGAAAVRTDADGTDSQRTIAGRIQATAGDGRGVVAQARNAFPRRTDERRRSPRPSRILAADHGAGTAGRHR